MGVEEMDGRDGGMTVGDGEERGESRGGKGEGRRGERVR